MRLDRDRRLLEKRGRRKTIKSTRQSTAAAATVEGVWGEDGKGLGDKSRFVVQLLLPSRYFPAGTVVCILHKAVQETARCRSLYSSFLFCFSVLQFQQERSLPSIF